MVPVSAQCIGWACLLAGVMLLLTAAALTRHHLYLRNSKHAAASGRTVAALLALLVFLALGAFFWAHVHNRKQLEARAQVALVAYAKEAMPLRIERQVP